MEAAFDQLRELAAEGESARQKVVVALRDLASSLEAPNDTIHRFGHMSKWALIWDCFGTWPVGTPPGLGFQNLVSSNIASRPARLLRFLAAIDAVSEIAETDKEVRYTANHVTRNLTEKVVEAGLTH
ncbi:hypothetical protein PG991_008216 [Apiospora marii]|uniref:Uncharacterized protein n=2 Tax=Apiospora marii TaxID=335849 RepID=A0ABR1RQB3_9PEZI